MKDNKLADWLENGFGKKGDVNEPVLSRVIREADKLNVPEMDSEMVFTHVMEGIEARKPKSKIINLKWITTIAASAIIILFTISYLFKDVEVGSTVGQQIAYTLPDNSRVILNGQSEISFEKRFASDRRIALKGEAFFEVKIGNTFTVKTMQGVVTVLGTSFNVFDRDGMFAVSCKTGSVQVVSHGNTKVIVPGQSVSLSDKKLFLDTIPTKEIATWQHGESSFVSRPLKEVLAALTAQYKLQLGSIPQHLQNQKYTGSFVHNDLNKALKMVFLPMGITYELKDGHTLVLTD